MNSRRLHKSILALLLAMLFVAPAMHVSAINPKQTPEPDGPVYVVQAGDSLWDIAARFRVSVAELASANGLSDPSQLVAGARLVIPGLSGVQGELTTRSVGLGEDLRGISRRYQVPMDILIRLNHLTSPEELYAGSTLVLPLQSDVAGSTSRTLVGSGRSLFELAIASDKSPWEFVFANDLPGTWGAMAGDVLHIPGREATGNGAEEPVSLPGAVSSLTLKPTPLVQGKVAVIEVTATQGISLTGSLNDHELNFFPNGQGSYFSLQGIHAMTEPGIYMMSIVGNLPAEAPGFGAEFRFSQSVLVSSGDYPFDPVLTVSPETIDPAVTQPEDAEWAALTATATPEKLWMGAFTSPAPPPFNDCWPSRFGNRRSYNGSDYSYFHTGLDFCGGVGTDILAPAAGKVVFAGPLTVRGNATVIDHGWGVYSAYLHQSEFLVKIGDTVEQGQTIGKVGGTGRVTGPHLHWEIWAGSVQVDPMDWLLETYP